MYNKGRFYFPLLLFVLGFAPRCAWGVQSPPSLLKHAVKVANIHAWSRAWSEQYGTYEFYWLSSHRLLYQTARQVDAHGRLLRGGGYYLWDLYTNRRTLLPTLTKRVLSFRQRQDESLYPSPDGQWLYMYAGHHSLMLCRVDGSQYREWNNTEGASWLPDSRKLIVELWGATRPHTVTQEKYVQRSVDPTQRDIPVPTLPSGIVLPNGEAVQAFWETAAPTIVHVTHYSKGPAFQKQWQKHLTWPTPTRLEDIALSPQGDRIACLLFVPHLQSRVQKSLPHLPHSAGRSSACYELWVCRPDGTHRKRLSILPSQAMTEENAESIQLAWLPGGERLSFVYQSALYTLPASLE